jgi:hypothetical protein
VITDDAFSDNVPAQVGEDQEQEPHDDDDAEDSESVTESDSYGSIAEKTTKNAAKMLTDNV